MEFTPPELLALVPLTIGIIQVLKYAGLPDRVAPLCSIVTSVGLAALEVTNVHVIILGGIAVGLMASGLWSERPRRLRPRSSKLPHRFDAS